MSKNSVDKELLSIKKAIDDLSSKITDKSVPTGEDEYEQEDYFEDDDKTIKSFSYKEYTNLVVERSIARVELRLTDKIDGIQKEILGQIKDIRPEKPNYVLIFFSFLLGTILSVIAVFIVIIPIYVENIWNGKSEVMQATITNNVQNSITSKIEEIHKEK
jgi:hypothetical protein